MKTEHAIVCGGLRLPGERMSASVTTLNLWPGPGRQPCVRLVIDDLHEPICRTVPKQFHDLIEIAAYVYCADQMVARGGIDVDTFGAHWRRRFHFHVPVREPDLWRTPDVGGALREVLEFLSDDFYDFTFYPAQGAPGIQQYLGLDEKGAVRFNAERVMLFSGGLDSLGGAIEEAVNQKRRIVLVNHRSTDKFCVKYRELVRLLTEKAGADLLRPLRVRISKAGMDGKEYTQRARSFLYSSVGATVAMMLGVRGVRFYENGVVSLNLPVCAQVVGSRSTRTTHPRVLAGMERLLTLLAGGPFTVDNPFLWVTKGEVVAGIVRAGCGPMIEPSRSCAHTWETSNEHTHCGVCSQCIDRRFGVLAAGAEAFDPLGHYKVDVFRESRSKDEDKIMGAAFLERANQVREMRDTADLLTTFPEVRRVLPHLGLDPGRGAEKVLDLYRRHAEEVNSGVETMLARHTRDLRLRTLPGDCLLWTVHAPNGVNVVPAEVPARRVEKTDKGEARKPKHALRRQAGVWELFVDGDRALVSDERAMEVLAFLLMHPKELPLHAVQIEARVGSTEGGGRVAAGTGDAGHDEPIEVGAVVQEASGGRLGGKGKILKAKLAELRRDAENDLLPESERSEAREEMYALLREADKGGRLRDEAGRAVDRVRKGLRRLHEGLVEQASKQDGEGKRAVQAFAEYVHKHVLVPSSRITGGGRGRRGGEAAGCFTHEPPPGVVWKD